MKTLLSIVMPFYNEAANVESVVRALLKATAHPDWDIELVCVQNGSTDQTGLILRRLADELPCVRVVEVSVNRGYGFGIRQGINAAAGTIVGYLDGDGQVSPDDVLRVLEPMQRARAAKACRIDRADGWQRRIVSGIYNALFRSLFGVRYRDANAKPKFLRKADLAKLALVSDDWFIDAEVMIKSAALGIAWAEVPVHFRNRAGGRSNVRWQAIAEFLGNLAQWRWGENYRAWKRTTLLS